MQNGTLTVTANPLKTSVNPPLTLGYGYAGGTSGVYYLNGKMDEVAVYGTVLSAARIADHYTAGTVAAPTNDCWVWDGADEVPASVFVWNGSAETPAAIEFA